MDGTTSNPPITNSQPSTSSSTSKSSDYINVKVKPVIYKSSTLKVSISTNQNFLYGVILRIIKSVYASKIPQITSALPKEWEKIKETDIEKISEMIGCYNKGAKMYNKIWDAVENRRLLGDWALPTCTQPIAAQITNWAYECAVSSPSSLNSHYKSFSSETYGETNLEQMTSILNELQLGPDDVFVDLGSGVGHLVVFTAAFTKIKKAVGIELSQLPASHAQDLQHYFKKLMGHFGKACSPFELFTGDFLDKKFRELITKEATVIFINNYVFSPDLLFEIKDKLLSELNDGVRIVTTKAFGDLKRGINDRHVRANAGSPTEAQTDVSSILDMRPMKSVTNGVSWTANVVKFWLHTVNNTKVFKYYEQKVSRKNGKSSSSSRESSQIKEKDPKRKDKEGSSDSSTSSSVKMECSTPKEEKEKDQKVASKRPAPETIVQNEKIEVKDEYDDDKFYGRTTRRMWKAQVGGYSDEKKPEPAPSPKYTDAEYTPSTKKAKKEKKEKDASEKKVKKEKTPKPAKTTPLNSPPQVMKSPKAAISIPHPPPNPVTTTPTTTKKIASATPLRPIANEPSVKIDADTMNVLNQMHEKTVTLTQQRHPVHDELARGELVCVAIHQPPQQPPKAAVVAPKVVPPVPQQLTQPQPHMVQPQPPTVTPAPPPLPPPQLIPATSNVPTALDLAADQRHTFMIPPTDPLYQFVVSTYLEFKNIINKAQVADPDLIASLLKDIDAERHRNGELNDSIQTVSAQISDALGKGVVNLRDRLNELDMANVNEVSELLSGSKQIVALHKTLTQRVANMEASCAQEEQKMREHGVIGEKTLEYYDQMILNEEFCAQKIGQQIAMWRNGAYDDSMPISAQPYPTSEHISPLGAANSANIASQPIARRNKPRQQRGAGTSFSKRVAGGASGGGGSANAAGKSEEQSEEVEREIQQFVQHALKVDNASKEKERRARGSGNGANGGEKVSRKGSTNPAASASSQQQHAPIVLPPSTIGQHLQQQQQQQQKDPSLMRSGPLLP